MRRDDPHLVELVPVTPQLTPAVLEEIRRLAAAEGILDSAWVYRAIEERMRRQHSPSVTLSEGGVDGARRWLAGEESDP